MLSLRPNMWLREGGVSAHCEAGRRLFCCGPLRGGPFWIVLVYILVSVYNLFFFIYCRPWIKRAIRVSAAWVGWENDDGCGHLKPHNAAELRACGAAAFIMNLNTQNSPYSNSNS